jgi:CRAL/TRIO domain
MTSWIWMKGINIAIADPIEPVCLDDDRQSVKGLIEEHWDKINEIREGIVNHVYYDSNKHDDLWIVRFYLSQKSIKKAIACANYTLNFRNEHRLDEIDIRAIAPQQVQSGIVYEFLNCFKYNDAMIYTHPHPQRGVVCFFKLSSIDQHNVVTTLSEEKWLPMFVYCSEWTFQWLDYVTRTTGRLTKSIRFIDVKGFTFSSFSRECSKRDGKVMKIMEDCYPQLLGSIFTINVPFFIDTIWNLYKLVLPKRVVDKFNIIKPFERENDRKKLLRYISENDVPDYVGGNTTITSNETETNNATTTSVSPDDVINAGKLQEC